MYQHTEIYFSIARHARDILLIEESYVLVYIYVCTCVWMQWVRNLCYYITKTFWFIQATCYCYVG